MKRLLAMTLGALALVLGVCPARAQAQYRTPSYSPYLNLLRPGNQAINYYGLVRPQFDTRNQLLGLQQQAAATAYEIQNPSGQMVTGHPVQFLNLSHYYGGGFGRGGIGGGGGFGAGVARPGGGAVAGAMPAGAAAGGGVRR
jgi:hypothetical protein